MMQSIIYSLILLILPAVMKQFSCCHTATPVQVCLFHDIPAILTSWQIGSGVPTMGADWKLFDGHTHKLSVQCTVAAVVQAVAHLPSLAEVPLWTT